MLVDATAFRAAIAPHLLWIKLALVALTCAAMFGAGWWVNGWRWESKENRENAALLKKVEETQRQYAEDKAKWEALSAADAVRIEGLGQQKDTLLATLNGLKLTRTITVKPNVQGECESAVLDDAFRLRWNTVVDEAAVGAAANSSD